MDKVLSEHGIGILRDKIFAEKVSTRMRVRPKFEATLNAFREIKARGRPPVITDDMLHTMLRRRASGEPVEDIRPDLFIPTGKRRGRSPSLASIYRALAEHEKRRAYPEAVEQAHVDFAVPQAKHLIGTATAASSLVSHIRPIFGGYYGYPKKPPLRLLHREDVGGADVRLAGE